MLFLGTSSCDRRMVVYNCSLFHWGIFGKFRPASMAEIHITFHN